MKLAISNIAWERWDDQAMFSLLHRYGVTGIEAAPGKFDFGSAMRQDAALAKVRRRLDDEGFSVPAFQAILFGHPEFGVFVPSTHAAFIEYLRTVAQIGFGLGARVLVFGAPRNRQRRQLSWEAAYPIAVEFFREAGAAVAAEGCVLGLEANPVEYQCDFLTNISEVCAFVREVESPGVRVHFDTGAVSMNGGNLVDDIRSAGDFVHYHVSEPLLANVADGRTDHTSGFTELRRTGYDGWVSIEMKRSEPEIKNVERALQKIVRCLDEADAREV